MKSTTHHFEEARFNKPTWCQYCNEFIKEIIGKQGLVVRVVATDMVLGYRCADCDTTIHKRCFDGARKLTCPVLARDGTDLVFMRLYSC